MTKRPDRDGAHTLDQADLFGPTAASLPVKTRRRTSQRALSHFASAASPQLSAPAGKSAAKIADNGLLNVRQAATRLGLSKSTLDKMRCAGRGPRFIKSTDRAIRYDPADLDAWIADRRRTSTSQN